MTYILHNTEGLISVKSMWKLSVVYYSKQHVSKHTFVVFTVQLTVWNDLLYNI